MVHSLAIPDTTFPLARLHPEPLRHLVFPTGPRREARREVLRLLRPQLVVDAGVGGFAAKFNNCVSPLTSSTTLCIWSIAPGRNTRRYRCGPCAPDQPRRREPPAPRLPRATPRTRPSLFAARRTARSEMARRSSPWPWRSRASRRSAAALSPRPRRRGDARRERGSNGPSRRRPSGGHETGGRSRADRQGLLSGAGAGQAKRTFARTHTETRVALNACAEASQVPWCADSAEAGSGATPRIRTNSRCRGRPKIDLSKRTR